MISVATQLHDRLSSTIDSAFSNGGGPRMRFNGVLLEAFFETSEGPQTVTNFYNHYSRAYIEQPFTNHYGRTWRSIKAHQAILTVLAPDYEETGNSLTILRPRHVSCINMFNTPSLIDSAEYTVSERDSPEGAILLTRDYERPIEITLEDSPYLGALAKVLGIEIE